jgi:two-component system CheB/CheR fusion protein
MSGDSGGDLEPNRIDFRLLVQQAAIGMEQVSLEARILGANDALCAILGYAPEELGGKSLAEIVHPDYLAQSLEKHQQLIGGMLPHYTLEAQYLRKDGSPVWVKVTSSLARSAEVSHAFRISIVNDISERVQARERRERDEAKYRAIIDTAVDSIVVIDEHGRIQAFNHAAEQTFGYRSSEVIGQNVRILMPEPDRGAHDGYIANYLGTGKAKIIGIGREVIGQRRDGSVFSLELSIAEWRAGGERYFTGIMRDVTDRKRSEEALQRLNETLEQRVADRTSALADANRRLTEQMGALQRAQAALQQAQKMEAIGQLTGGIAHDFNNLLTAICGNLDVLSLRIGDDRAKQRLIDAAQQAAERGAQLTGQLLAFARQQTLRPEAANLVMLIHDFRILIDRAAGATIEVKVRNGRQIWPVLVDSAQFQSAILNLVMNARDAMPGGGRLVIDARNVVIDQQMAASIADLTPGEYVMVAVGETGGGMTPHVIARAFEPFFTTKEPGRGTGLGLSQVYGFARQSGGTVTIESALGRGTTVRLYLPHAHDVVAAARPPTEFAEADTEREVVLVVEDDPNVLDTVVANLASLGYRTVVARSGHEALEILRSSEPIDLLFTDVVLPGGLNGVQIAREAVRIRSGLRVLLTTGRIGLSEPMPTVIDDRLPMLRKPYRRPDLAKKLNEVLRS